MRTIQITAMAALLAFGLAGCSKETEGGRTPDNPKFTGKGAYVSVRIATPQGEATRASSEEDASPEEEAIKSLFILTFGDSDKLVPVPIEGSTGTKPFIELTAPADNDSSTPNVFDTEAQLISGDATNLVVVANPGTALATRIRTLGAGSTYTDFNKAIAGVTVADVTGMASAATAIANAKFTMISTGNPKLSTGVGDMTDDVTTAFVEIEPGKLQVVTTTVTVDKAKEDAEKNPVEMTIERLSAKLELTAVADATITKPAGSTFAFGGWTLDAVNTTYFPFASKNLRGSHGTGLFYNHNFYTTDPNYSAADVNEDTGYHDGLKYGTVAKDATTGWAPVLPWTDATNTKGYYDWLAKDAETYAVENTMAGGQEATLFGNATRVVIKAKYYPAAVDDAVVAAGGDWFMYNNNENDPNLVFSSITELQNAYKAETVPGTFDNPNLRKACEQFFKQIQAYCTTMGVTGVPANFAGLDATFLAKIDDGGEVAKVPAEPEELAGVGIRWFQNGLNYYYYEIRHDNTVTANNAYTKYGVVRNNWYTMNLNSVSGHGTPWYPDVTDPGDGDPDPETEIDKEVGYIGIAIKRAPWVKWVTNFGI
jgi:hypothetical protein